MAIYSCNLSSIGKTTHQAGTAGAHIRYIAREGAEPVIIAQDMPHDPKQARTFMDQQERDMRKNGRVIDKIRLALPRELDEVQRAELVRDFMADLSGDKRVPWYAAIHQTGEDAHNPHAHIAVHDRDIETGKRVLRLSDSARDRRKAGLAGPKAVDWIRERWEVVANHALAQAGHDVTIDRRSLADQGIDREPTIHEGPCGQHINNNVKRPSSKAVFNGAGRLIDYPAIDNGKTRREHNAQIIDFNLARAAKSGDAATATWAQFEKEQLAKDRELESQLAADRQQHTTERRVVSGKYTAQRKRISAEQKLKKRRAVSYVRAEFQPRREAMRARQQAERRDLRQKHRGLLARIARKLSQTVTEYHLAQRRAQIEAHKAERRLLAQTYQQARQKALDGLLRRYMAEFEQVQEKRSAHLAQLDARYRQTLDFADLARQQREAEREQARHVTESKIQEWKKQARQSAAEDKLQAGFAHVADPERAKQDALEAAYKKVRQKEKEEEERERMGRGGHSDRQRGR